MRLPQNAKRPPLMKKKSNPASTSHITQCGWCKELAPVWEELSDEWGSHQVGLVAEIDCMDPAGRALCEANGIQKFPTLLYGDPQNLDEYEGDRDLDTLSAFAKEHLKPVCSPANINVCDDDKRAEIEQYMALPDTQLDAKIAEYEALEQEAMDHFNAELEKLRESFGLLERTKDETAAAVQEAGLGLLKSVRASKAKAAAKNEL